MYAAVTSNNTGVDVALLTGFGKPIALVIDLESGYIEFPPRSSDVIETRCMAVMFVGVELMRAGDTNAMPSSDPRSIYGPKLVDHRMR
jgi:hypothetical protein